MATADLLTVAGLAVATTLVTQIITHAWTSFDTGRFGPLLAVGVALLLAIPASLYLGSDPFQAVLTALIAGSSAAGIYDVSKTSYLNVRNR